VKKCEKEIKALLNTLDHLKVRNKNYRDKFMSGAEGADLERKQILEDQFRAASETLFRKRREMGIHEQNFKSASLELVQIRNQKTEGEREDSEVAQVHQQADQELQVIVQGLDRANQSKESRLNNARAVRGQAFDDSPENLAVLFEVEREKNAYMLNALSHLVNNPVMLKEADRLVAEIQTSLGENNIPIPEMPNDQMDRPMTSSSQRSGQQQ